MHELELKIGYEFQNFQLLVQAMSHSSYANEQRKGRLGSNERLEFLGDAVLELISSEFLYGKYKEQPEGELTRKRASLVCEPTLAMCARDLGVDQYLLLGKGEEQTGGRSRDSIVSDGLEALIGAIYLDGGLANAKEFILKAVLSDAEHKQLFYDSKTILQELVQEKGNNPILYQLLDEAGPDHNKSFTVEVSIGGRRLGVGSGHTKKAAEQAAAYQAVCTLKKQ
ncbi:MAG: ribonuclease III [Blautia sp.]